MLNSFNISNMNFWKKNFDSIVEYQSFSNVVGDDRNKFDFFNIYFFFDVSFD